MSESAKSSLKEMSLCPRCSSLRNIGSKTRYGSEEASRASWTQFEDGILPLSAFGLGNVVDWVMIYFLTAGGVVKNNDVTKFCLLYFIDMYQ